jgi:hypothetical protein
MEKSLYNTYVTTGVLEKQVEDLMIKNKENQNKYNKTCVKKRGFMRAQARKKKCVELKLLKTYTENQLSKAMNELNTHNNRGILSNYDTVVAAGISPEDLEEIRKTRKKPEPRTQMFKPRTPHGSPRSSFSEEVPDVTEAHAANVQKKWNKHFNKEGKVQSVISALGGKRRRKRRTKKKRGYGGKSPKRTKKRKKSKRRKSRRKRRRTRRRRR